MSAPIVFVKAGGHYVAESLFIVALFALAAITIFLVARSFRESIMLRRFFALSIDLTILASLIYAASFRFRDAMISLGEWGLAIGLALFVLYFAVLDSAAGGGATLGKRFAGLRVSDAGNKRLSLGRSVIRATILGLAIFAFEFPIRRQISGNAAIEIATAVWSLVTIGIGGAMLLMLVTRQGAQGVHDLAVGAHVLPARQEPSSAGIGAGHALGLLAIFAASLAVPSVPLAWFETWEPARSLIYFPCAVWRAVDFDPTMVMSELNIEGSSGSVEIDVWVFEPTADLDAAVQHVASRVLALSPNLEGYKVLTVTAATGWNFGIAYGEHGRIHSGTLEEWRQGRQTRQSFRADVAGAFSRSSQSD